MRNNKMLMMARDYIVVFCGAILAAFAIEEFLVPCTILDGGIVGISIIINALSGFSLALLTFALNIPFLLACSGKLGKEFVVKSAFAMASFSIALGIFEEFTNATDQPLLAVSFGGLILGVGVGLVIKFGGCLDGTEAVAIIINKKFKIPVGNSVLACNVVIYAVAGILFGFNRAMYSLLSFFIASRILEMVETGGEQAKAAMIITTDAKDIANEIYKRLGRTVTIMEGEGMVSGKKVVLYCVMTKYEVKELKSIIAGIDQSAFVAVSDVSEIIGNHIKRYDAIKVNKSKEEE